MENGDHSRQKKRTERMRSIYLFGPEIKEISGAVKISKDRLRISSNEEISTKTSGYQGKVAQVLKN